MKMLLMALMVLSFSSHAYDVAMGERVYDNMVKTFLSQANDPSTTIGALVESKREQMRDGRNPDGGFSPVLKVEDLGIVLLRSYVDMRRRCSIDGDRLVCQGRSIEETYLVTLAQEQCHNSGCDQDTADLTFKVEVGATEKCEGTADQDPYGDDICTETLYVKEFKAVSL